MYSTLIRKELLHNMMTLRFALVTILLVILSVSATSIRSLMFNRLQETHNQAVNERIRLDREKTMSMWMRQHLGHTIERPPNPISVFAGGLDQEMTRSVRFAGNNQYSIGDITRIELGGRSLEIPSMRVFYGLDMATIITLICSLLALLLVFDTVSGERESGTLKVVMSGPLPRDTFIVTKLIAGLVTILVPLVLAWGFSLLCAFLLMKTHFTLGDLTRLGAMVIFSALYTGVFFAAGMTASIWSRRSATALGVCLTVWIILGVAIPNLAPLVVRRFVSVPSSAKINLELNSREQAIWADKMPQWQKELAIEGKSTWDQQFPELAKFAESYLLEEVSQYLRFQQIRLSRQIALEGVAAKISPSAVFLFSAANLAGTGSNDYLSFIGDVDKYRSEFLAVRHSQWVQYAKTYDDYIVYDPDKWPRFISRRLDAGKVFGAVWPDVVILLAISMVLFFTAYVGFLRMDLTQ